MSDPSAADRPFSAALARKRDIILAHEGDYARALGSRVVDKPVVSLWMVLIPILFLHYMHRHQKFKAGVAAFAAEFLRPRERALALALGSADESAAYPASPSDSATRLQQAEALQVELLTVHYRRLLRAAGESYRDLLRGAYGSRADYEAYLQALSETDGEINAAVLGAAPADAAIREIVRRLDEALRAMRRDELAAFYGESR